MRKPLVRKLLVRKLLVRKPLVENHMVRKPLGENHMVKRKVYGVKAYDKDCREVKDRQNNLGGNWATDRKKALLKRIRLEIRM